VLTFYTVASLVMQNTGQQYDPVQATFFLFIPNFVAIPAAPCFGILIDKKGRSLFFLLTAGIMQVCTHVVFLGMTEEWYIINPTYIMIWLGIAYSMFASSIWPLLPFVIRQPLLATGYGTMTSIQNAGLAIFPQIIGSIMEADSIKFTKWKYVIPILIFICCAGASIVLTIFLWIVDKARTGGILNDDGKKKQEYKTNVINGNDSI